MIKTYHQGEKTQLSPHFKASEFACKCSKPHDFQIDEDLITKLEALYDALGCSEITVSSGYRCVEHDKAVGGSGTGQHTLGRAADICCKDAAGKPIVSYLVCCAAQDVEFRGIARINDAYTHCDTRTSGIWYGDETKGSSYCIPQKDFYDYFSIKKGGDEMNGIDVSEHNGVIDWAKVKASGVQFAILRAGLGRYATQKDKNFELNYTAAKEAGVPVGVYWYSYAVDPEEAKKEAAACIAVIRGGEYEFPIFFDQEEKISLDTGKANCSAMVRAFCSELEKAGYWAGLYTSRSVLQTHIEDDIKSRYTLWIAEWGNKLNYSGAVGIWQRSSTGIIDGISGDVDLDISYRDFPTLIKAKGLNGYGGKPPEPEKSEVSVEMVIDGKKYKGTLKEE